MRSPRHLLGAALALAVLVGAAAPAAAHVSVQPAEAARGSVADLRFSVPNERDDAATVEIALQLPGTFEVVEPQPADGWTGTVDGDVVRWRGGRLAGAERVELGLRLGPLPDGDVLVFPAVQTYDSGEVVRWIETGGGRDHPAPVLTLTGAPAAEPTTTTTAETTTTTAEATTTTAEASTTTATDDDDGGPAVWTLVLAGVVAVLTAGSYVLTRRRHPR